jgi:hypothetical protein
MNDARLEPRSLALPEAGVLAALLAGAVEELRPVLLVLGSEVGIACRQVGHAGAPPPARGRHAGAYHHTGNGAKEDLVPAIQGAEPYPCLPVPDSLADAIFADVARLVERRAADLLHACRRG